MSGLDLSAGRVAVIMGAASGIGRALARACAAAEMMVVLADMDGEGLDSLGLALKEDGREGMVMTCDVGQLAEVEELAAVAFDEYGAVHLLVNNDRSAEVAGASWEIPHATWKSALASGLWGHLHGVQAFVPRMIDSGEPGWIVNITAMTGLNAAPHCVANAGVLALSEALSLDLARTGARIGVTVSCLPAADESAPPGEEAASLILAAVRQGCFAVFTDERLASRAVDRARRLAAGERPALTE